MQLVFDLKNTIGGLFWDDNKILVGSNGKFLQIDTVGNILQTIIVDGDENTLIKYFEKDKNNNIWIATNNGLFIWDKKNKPTQIKNISEHFFYTLAQEKNNNYIWCSSNTGLYRININDKHFAQYTANDGLVNNEFNTNSCTKNTDGTIYFGTPKGINSIDPTKLLAYAQAPTPTIINISAGNFNLGMDTAINQLSSISFSHKENDININFASIDFSSEDENMYRYRFANNDTVWKEISKTRSLNFVLEPGRYLFQVQAGKQLNGYNPIYKQIEIIIQPPFYKTWWFIGLMSVLILSGVFALGFAIKNYIDRKKIVVLKMQMQLQKERERISKDLHDNIGAQATALFYGIEGLEKNDKTEKMVSLKQTTQDMMDGLRETIWALGKGEVNVTALSDRFKLFMKKISKHYPQIKFTVQENIDADKLLTAEQALHVLRILQEALNNALKHAQAKNIIFIVESKDNISIKIKDDGKGIDGKTTSNFSDGNGMINMKERAAIAGFGFKVESEKSNGTSISLLK
jgi:signal transduction histidine kinase